ncbi:MAG: hypothetical protein IJ195_03915 [Lachnospiraceae bacterium]|nr:hypothetical protein [Lachnospiraceae bacterium]
MAGVEFAKYGTSSAGEMAVHFDNDIRSNPSVNHTNKDIDITQTHRNYYIGADNYQEIASKIEAIIEKADREPPPKRLRKDRKTMFSLEVPCPPELEGTPEEDRFYELVYS